MDSQPEACAECIQRCLTVHKQRKGSSIIISFFKVLIGDQFSKLLFFPPKFAPTVSELVGQETFLEDATANQWKVTISKLNGSIAFQKGWKEFSIDHGLEIGDLVVFHYIMGSHFVVKIYGKTGCEKDISGIRKSKKRGRSRKNPIVEEALCCAFVKRGSDHGSSSYKVNNVEKVQTTAEYASNSTKSQIKDQATAKEALCCNFVESLISNQMSSSCNVNDQATGKGALCCTFEKRSISNHTSTSCKVNDFEKEVNGMEKVQGIAECTWNNGDTSRMSPPAKANYIEEPFYMMNRDSGDKGENRTTIFDLFDFEIRKNKSEPNGGNKDETSCWNVDKSLRSQSKCGVANEDFIFEEAGGGTNIDKSNSEMSEMDKNLIEVEEMVTVSNKDLCSPISEHNLFNSAGRPRNDKRNYSHVSKECQISDGRCKGKSEKNCSNGGELNIVEEELVDMKPKPLKHKQIHEISGEEPIIIKDVPGGRRKGVGEGNETYGMVGTGSSNLISISLPIALSCLVTTDSQAFLELPKRLPSSSGKARSKMGRRVVLLRDPNKRLWPVLYRESHGRKVLMSGWEGISKANNIKQGDECVFGVESGAKGIYGIIINRKSDGK